MLSRNPDPNEIISVIEIVICGNPQRKELPLWPLRELCHQEQSQLCCFFRKRRKKCFSSWKKTTSVKADSWCPVNINPNFPANLGMDQCCGMHQSSSAQVLVEKKNKHRNYSNNIIVIIVIIVVIVIILVVEVVGVIAILYLLWAILYLLYTLYVLYIL